MRFLLIKKSLTIAALSDSGKRLFAVLGIAGTLCLQPFPAQAIKERQDILALSDENLRKTLILLKAYNNPAAEKLLFWIYMTQTNLPVSPQELIAFHDNNQGWPLLWLARKKIEKSLWLENDKTLSHSWFTQHPPQTIEGLQTALRDLKDDRLLNDFWAAGLGDADDAKRILENFGAKITPSAQAARLRKLIQEKRYAEARALLPHAPASARKKARAQISLARLEKDASALVNALPPALQNDPDVIFERFRWNVRKQRAEAAFDLLKSAAKMKMETDLWWPDANALARDALQNENPGRAFDIAMLIPVNKSDTNWANIAWFQGWLALKQNPPRLDVAAAKFDMLFNDAHSSITKSRGAYWRAIVAEKGNDPATAALWYERCRNFTISFYGQVCETLHPTPQQQIPAAAVAIGPETPLTTPLPPAQAEIKNAAYLLYVIGLKDLSDGFFAALLQNAADLSAYQHVADLALQSGRPDWAVEANKRAQQNLAQSIGEDGYPRLPPGYLPAAPESALIHAIVYRESMYRPDAVSPVGALGLMQLMPATAKMMAGQNKMPYDRARLMHDGAYNVFLGSFYLQSLLDDYNGFYPLAVAAYNAGPRRVAQWIDAYGDPRNLHTTHEIIDWIEHIPIYETRNYVQRVIETIHMYAPERRGLTLFKSVSSK